MTLAMFSLPYLHLTLYQYRHTEMRDVLFDSSSVLYWLLKLWPGTFPVPNRHMNCGDFTHLSLSETVAPLVLTSYIHMNLRTTRKTSEQVPRRGKKIVYKQQMGWLFSFVSKFLLYTRISCGTWRLPVWILDGEGYSKVSAIRNGKIVQPITFRTG